MKLIIKYGYWLVLAFLGLVALFLVASTLNIPGGYKLYTVQSGSMLPQIKIGSIVVSRQASAYQVGDIITFKNAPAPVTHRIFSATESAGRLNFITKGDANETPDTEPVLQEQVLGKVIATLPFLGYPVAFAKTKQGFLFLIIIPAVIIVYSEILNIKNEVIKLLKKRKAKKVTKQKKS
jgi:signal peptidase